MTAVEFLVKELNEKAIVGGTIDRFVMNNAIEQAKEMEKEQIENAFEAGFITQQWDKTKENKAEQYYNQKFNK